MQLWSDHRCGWLALHLISGLGNVAYKNLLDRFDTPERVFSATIPKLMEVEGVRKEVSESIINRKFSKDPEMELEKIKRSGAPAFPKALPLPSRPITEPPEVPWCLFSHWEFPEMR